MSLDVGIHVFNNVKCFHLIDLHDNVLNWSQMIKYHAALQWSGISTRGTAIWLEVIYMSNLNWAGLYKLSSRDGSTWAASMGCWDVLVIDGHPSEVALWPARSVNDAWTSDRGQPQRTWLHGFCKWQWSNIKHFLYHDDHQVRTLNKNLC